MRISIFNSRLDASVAERFPGHEVCVGDDRPQSAAEFLEQARGVQVLGIRRINGFEFDRSVVEQLPELQFLHKTGTGTDWLDLEALNEHGILAATNDGVNAAAVADHVVLLAQLGLRGTLAKLTEMRNGTWNRDPRQYESIPIHGKTVGIVGLGQIGTEVARRMLAAGARIVAYGRQPRPVPSVHGEVRWLSLDELLRVSDVVALCVALNPATERLIGARELALMKPTAVLVNCSRGRVVDERALYEALANRRIRAAGLDVFEQEPTPPDNPLLALDNVLATPHIAGYGADQVAGLLDNLERFARGRRPLRLLNPELIERGTARARHLEAAGPDE